LNKYGIDNHICSTVVQIYILLEVHYF